MARDTEATTQVSRTLPAWATGPRAVVCFALLLAAGGAGAVVAVQQWVGGPDLAVTVPWWLLAIGFFVTELFVIHLHFGRDSHTCTLSEVPVVIGLTLCSPIGFFAARLLGAGLALLGPGRQSSLKVGFNLGLFAIETGLALVVYRLILAGASPLSFRGWAAAFAATAAAMAFSSAAVPVAISFHQGQWHLGILPPVVATSAVATLTNTSLGLLIVSILALDPRIGLLLLGVVVMLAVAYRGYTRLREQHTNLEQLHEFTRVATSALHDGSTVRSLLQQTRKLLRAEVAEITLLPGEGETLPTRVRIDADDKITVTQLEEGLQAQHAAVLADGAALLIPRSTKNRALRECLTAEGLVDAIIVRLQDRTRPVGTLLVGSRLGDVSTFTPDDVKLLETMAAHAGITLANVRLVDQLRREVAEKEHQASHDALTGLANRTLFQQEVNDVIFGTVRHHEDAAAVMLLDLDRFKEVNDALGHHVGDVLLVEIGRRLREVAPEGATIARLGGDEFSVLLRHTTERGAGEVATAVREALAQPFVYRELRLFVGASVGIALWPEHGGDSVTLLQRADVAMYTAKENRSGVEVYNTALDRHSSQRLALMADFKETIEEDRLEVRYQPKVDLRTGQVTGVEALARWSHEHLGWVSPEEFIPIAEHTGLIRPLTSFVLRTALRQIRAWADEGIDLTLAVNLSAASLLDADLPGDVVALLEETGVPASSLILELTESTIMADPAHAVAILTELDRMGVEIAVDDFGTGYSSLSHLKRLPVSELKIDKSFVLNMASDENDAAIVHSTIDLARNLGLRLVAEGVEDRVTFDRLRELGCELAQGFFIARPLGAAAVASWVSEWSAADPAPRSGRDHLRLVQTTA